MSKPEETQQQQQQQKQQQSSHHHHEHNSKNDSSAEFVKSLGLKLEKDNEGELRSPRWWNDLMPEDNVASPSKSASLSQLLRNDDDKEKEKELNTEGLEDFFSSIHFDAQSTVPPTSSVTAKREGDGTKKNASANINDEEVEEVDLLDSMTLEANQSLQEAKYHHEKVSAEYEKAAKDMESIMEALSEPVAEKDNNKKKGEGKAKAKGKEEGGEEEKEKSSRLNNNGHTSDHKNSNSSSSHPDADSNRHSKDKYVFGNSMKNKYWNDKRKAEELYQKGCELMQSIENGAYHDAIMCFEALLGNHHNKISIQWSEVWRKLGECHMHNDNESQAIGAFEKCVELSKEKNASLAMIRLATAYANEENVEQVIHYLNLYLKCNIKQYQALLGDTYTSYNEEDLTAYDLIDLYSVIKKANDQHASSSSSSKTNHANTNNNQAEICQILGILYCVINDLNKAAEHFRLCVHINSNDHILWNQLGACLSNSGNYKLALEAYHKALELKPNYVRALTNTAVAYFNDKNYEDACQYYIKTLLQNSHIDVWEDFAAALRATNRNDIADSIVSAPEKRDIKQIWMLCNQKK